MANIPIHVPYFEMSSSSSTQMKTLRTTNNLNNNISRSQRKTKYSSLTINTGRIYKSTGEGSNCNSESESNYKQPGTGGGGNDWAG